MGLFSRIFRPSTAKTAAEGQYRDGPWWLPVSGGWLSNDAGKNANWWQLGYDVSRPSTSSAMVEACVSRYSQTIAMCPGDHWRTKDDGGRERVKNSALSRILRRPNTYQSMSDFMLNATRSLFMDGNAYALATRNDRFEIAELHLMNPRNCGISLAETGDIFYSLGGNEIIEKRLAYAGSPALTLVPARDVLHIRLHTPRHPLKGETPLAAAALDIAASGAMTEQQYAFYANQARPSTVLGTDHILTVEQIKVIRDMWDQQSRGLNTGGTPILSAGLKPMPLATSAKDAQLAELMRMTEQHIALVFGVPLQILGMGGNTFASTETLMQSWIASGLGFAINHIEEAFGQLFSLRGMPDEYVEFDTRALLRSAHKDRIEALARGVQGGIYAPNEARAEEGYAAVEHGDEPRVQQQVVPLSFWGQQPPAPAAPAPAEPSAEEPIEDEQRDFADIILAAARRHVERAP